MDGGEIDNRAGAPSADGAPGGRVHLPPRTALLHDRFVVQRMLGRGGMGAVYEVLDTERDATVALKILSEVDAAGIYRLKLEFRALADVVHPNLVGLHELHCEQDRWFFTMDLVPGEPLLDDLGDEPDDKKLRRAFAQLAAGIQAIHDAGKLHRDLKPSNVMVTPEGRVVILDFGLASDKEIGGAGQTITDGSVSGTPAYMSPEQAASRPATPASDWYAFGVMLFEVLTGRLPFEGNLPSVMYRKMHEDAPQASSFRQGIPGDLEQLCERLLQRDPADRCGYAEVMQVLGAVSDRPESLSISEDAPFVGRVEELAVLQRAFETVSRGRPVVMFVHGVSGVGKTVLVERFLRALEREGKAVVLNGRCYERESMPFKAFDSIIDALSRYLRRLSPTEAARVLPREIASLVRLFPALERVQAVASSPRPSAEVPDPFEVRRRGFAALREMFARMSDRKPLVLHVDNLQWGDFDSAMLLQALLGPPDPPSLFFIGSYRRDEAQSSAFLRELLDSKRIDSGSKQVWMLPVDALDRVEAGRLVELLLEDERRDLERLVETICRESEGIPYFITELVRYARSEHGIEELNTGGKDSLLPRLLNTRIRALPEAAQALLETISVAGRPLRQELALQAADIAASDYGVMNTLRSATLARTGGPSLADAVETYHDRIRETLLSSLPPRRLRQRHAQLADTLEASGTADAEWLLEQFHGAGVASKAGEYAVMAADQADRVKAFTRAAELYRLALELLQPASEGTLYRELWTKLGESLANAGRGAESAAAFLQPSKHAPAGEALALKRRAAEQYLVSGHLKEGFGLMRKVLATLGMRLPSTPTGGLLSAFFWQVRIWLRGFDFREREHAEIPAPDLARLDTCWSLSIGLVMTDTVRSLAYISRFLLLALRAGEPYRVALALAVEGAAMGALGVSMKTRIDKLLIQADALSRRIGYPHALGLTQTCVAAANFCHGEWKQTREAGERAIRIFREQCTGVAWELSTVRLFYLGSLYYLGRFRELARRTPRLLEEAKQRGDIYAAVNFRTTCVMAAWLVRDDVERIRQHLNEARADWSFEGYHLQHMNLIWAECLLDFYTGKYAAPWIRLRNEWSAIKRSKLFWLQLYRVEIGFIRAASALLAARSTAGDEDSADRRAFLRIAARDARKLRRENFPCARGYAWLIRAGLASARGNADRAMAHLAVAAEGFDAADMALHAAAARRQLGRLQGGEQGDRLIRDADALMAEETVKNPERMAAMLAPGFD
jgi:hypothetical protein